MNIIICRLLIAAAFLLPFMPHAQTNAGTDIQPLHVGDKMPDIELFHLLNYKDSTAHLSDFTGQAIIIDFWATWCTPCVDKIPFLQQEQDKYAATLKIISVAYENTHGIRRFIDRVNKTTRFSLLTVTEDDAQLDNGTLLKYFPHTVVPHYVWIDKNRIIRGITGIENFSDANIDNLLQEKFVGSPAAVPISAGKTAAVSKPVLDTVGTDVMMELGKGPYGSIKKKDFRECCLFTGPVWGPNGSLIGGAHGGLTLSKWFKKRPYPEIAQYLDREIQIYHYMPLSMYSFAYRNLLSDSMNDDPVGKRIVITTNDTAKINLLTPDFIKSRTFCYLRVVPAPMSEAQLYQVMRDDLTHFFGITGRVEKRKMLCYALTVTDTAKAKTKGGEQYTNRSLYGIKQTNITVEDLAITLRFFNEVGTRTVDNVIINESTWQGKIDVDIACRMDDPAAIKKELQKSGMDLVAKIAEVPVLVLEDAPAAKGR